MVAGLVVEYEKPFLLRTSSICAREYSGNLLSCSEKICISRQIDVTVDIYEE